jgi:glycosyltransferase involved in cell wall biosynthesis
LLPELVHFAAIMAIMMQAILMSMTAGRLSISLCTFNGARFLPEQLASLAAQTLKPTELVVCDDHSTDESARIVQDFAATSPFPVQLHIQPKNLGWAANRQDSYARCNADLIAVCDQDDVWDPSKLELMVRTLERNPQRSMVFCDSRVVNESLEPLGYTTFQITAFDKSRQRLVAEGRALEALMANIPVADATIIFRPSLLKSVLPIPEKWLPDAWTAIVAAATDGCAIVPQPLQSYRQHPQNLSGGKRYGFTERYRRARQTEEYFQLQETRFQILRERLVSLPAGSASENNLNMIDRRIRFAQARGQMRRHPLARPFLILRELARGNYHRMGTGLRTLAMDLVI